MKNKPKRKGIINNFSYLEKVYLKGKINHFTTKPNLSDELVFLVTDIKIWNDNTTLYYDHLWIEDGVINKYMVGHEVIIKGEVAYYQRKNETYDYTILPKQLIIDITVEQRRNIHANNMIDKTFPARETKIMIQDSKDAHIERTYKEKAKKASRARKKEPENKTRNLTLADVIGE